MASPAYIENRARSTLVFVFFLMTVIGGCERERSKAAEPFIADVELPGCQASLAIDPAQAMKDSSVTLANCQSLDEVVIKADMTNMKMNIAPITLKQMDGGDWRGTMTFTMSGPWYVELHASEGTETTVKRYDLSIP